MENFLVITDPGVVVVDENDPGTLPKVGDIVHVLKSDIFLSGRCYVIPSLPGANTPVMLLSETTTVLAMKHGRAHDVFEPHTGMIYFHIEESEDSKEITRRIVDAFHKSLDRDDIKFVRMEDRFSVWWRA
jgi:hypothetical protein